MANVIVNSTPFILSTSEANSFGLDNAVSGNEQLLALDVNNTTDAPTGTNKRVAIKSLPKVRLVIAETAPDLDLNVLWIKPSTKKVSAVIGGAWENLSRNVINVLLRLSGSRGIITGTGPFEDYRSGIQTYIAWDGSIRTAQAGLVVFENGRLTNPNDGEMYNAGLVGWRWETTDPGGAPLAIKPRIAIEPSGINTAFPSTGAIFASDGTVLKTANALLSPNGVVDATRVVCNTATAQIKDIYRNGTYSSGIYALQVDVKYLGYQFLQLGLQGVNTYSQNVFDVLNGIKGESAASTSNSVLDANIIPLSNGFFRLRVLVNTTGNTFLTLQIANTLTGNTRSVNGDIISPGDVGNGFYCINFDVKNQPFFSSTIPTTTAAVSRAANQLNLPAIGNLSPDELTIGMHWRRGYKNAETSHVTSATEVILAIAGGDRIYKPGNSNIYVLLDRLGAVSTIDVGTAIQSDFYLFVRASKTANTMQIGISFNGTAWIWGNVASFAGFGFTSGNLEPFKTPSCRFEMFAMRTYAGMKPIAEIESSAIVELAP
jgi:hypothetical protein